MPLKRDEDAALFSTIHTLLEEQQHPVQVEHRQGGERRPFTCSQLMAPYDGWTLPKQSDFRLVECHDLSPSGFSFLSPERPEYEHLVIALGEIPFTFFSAQVMHARAAVPKPGNPYLVGCRFLHRLAT